MESRRLLLYNMDVSTSNSHFLVVVSLINVEETMYPIC